VALNDQTTKKVLPPVYFLAAIVLAVALHFLFPIRQLIEFPWRLAGLVPSIIGLTIALSADRMFRQCNTTVKPFEKSNALVTSGVFAMTRNPMYLGLTLGLLGIAVFLGSVISMLPVIVFPILLDRLFIQKEERMLEETFGGRFLEYKSRVRRWI
jgi:protein-S-isoprenylcysteine O-methyltransferase Ste14